MTRRVAKHGRERLANLRAITTAGARTFQTIPNTSFYDDAPGMRIADQKKRCCIDAHEELRNYTHLKIDRLEG